VRRNEMTQRDDAKERKRRTLEADVRNADADLQVLERTRQGAISRNDDEAVAMVAREIRRVRGIRDEAKRKLQQLGR
jgi:hypothetical protein